MGHVVGFDVSTTAVKAVVMDAGGGLRAAAESGYAYSTPRPLWSEQDPAVWWGAGTEALGAALARAGVTGGDVDAVGLTGQMHGLVALDAADRVLRPAILWNDQRTATQCDEIRAVVGRDRLISITGNDALPGFTAPKLMWVRAHEPEVWRRIAHVVLPKDYTRLRLTGDHAVDRADGAGTLLFDLARRDWSDDVVGALGIDPAWLPRTYEGPEVTGVVSESGAAATGLRAGTPVVAGGGDQAAAAVGVGAVDPQVVSVSLGTSGVVFTSSEQPLIELEGRLHSFCHCVPGRWHVMGVMLSAAGSLRWYRDALAPDRGFDDLADEAATAPAGAGGLLFLPYLTGERSPYADPLARAAFVGLTVGHERAHMTRAVMEGVAFGLRDLLGLMADADVPQPSEIRATGGGSRSALWRGILADVLGSPVVTTSTSEGAAHGAAILAGVGLGWWPTVQDACNAVVRVTGAVEPSPRAGLYREHYERYRRLYPALAPTFHSLPVEHPE